MLSHLATLLLFTIGVHAAEPPPTHLHDPSTIIQEKDIYWVFSTGNGIKVHSSKDLKTWTRSTPIFKKPLPWLKDIAATQRGHLWAPDIIKVGKNYHLYYSISAFGEQTSAIALATSPTLDPTSENYKWTDQGIVIQSKKGDPYNCIDPALIRDGTKLWMTFGSFWHGIYLIELAPLSGKRPTKPTAPIRLASAPEIEAPFLHKRGDYYYLFLNHGLCCRGIKSTYQILVGRSKKITGPYLDKDGTDLRQTGGSLLLSSKGNAIGPGHPSIALDKKGNEQLVHHYYDATRKGRSVLALKPLHWDKKHWPSVSTD